LRCNFFLAELDSWNFCLNFIFSRKKSLVRWRFTSSCLFSL